jgi:GH15 family glucan-1,4-alpha-glucosidase
LDFQRKNRRGHGNRNKSRVWFTLSHGIFNEIFYPRIDQACVRDMGLIVTDGVDFFSEEKRDTDSLITGWPTVSRHSGWSIRAALADTASKSRL